MHRVVPHGVLNECGAIHVGRGSFFSPTSSHNATLPPTFRIKVCKQSIVQGQPESNWLALPIFVAQAKLSPHEHE
jgi:hypothetical protein